MTRDVRIIGIGAGSPAHLTLEAITALREVDVFLVADKGDVKRDLVAAREALCEQHCEPGTYRFVTVPDPQRGPDAQRSGSQYTAGVVDWHQARADVWADAIEQLPSSATIGFLVWGDPAFYDSTIRIVRRMQQRLDLDVQVVPGISAFQTLAAAHRVVLHEIGQPIHITTGRRLVAEYSPDLGAVVVMLDGHLAVEALVERHPDLTTYWGANLGLPSQRLVAGRLSDVFAEIKSARADVKAQHGWCMDVYALLPETAALP